MARPRSGRSASKPTRRKEFVATASTVGHKNQHADSRNPPGVDLDGDARADWTAQNVHDALRQVIRYSTAASSAEPRGINNPSCGLSFTSAGCGRERQSVSRRPARPLRRVRIPQVDRTIRAPARIGCVARATRMLWSRALPAVVINMSCASARPRETFRQIDLQYGTYNAPGRGRTSTSAAPSIPRRSFSISVTDYSASCPTPRVNNAEQQRIAISDPARCRRVHGRTTTTSLTIIANYRERSQRGLCTNNLAGIRRWRAGPVEQRHSAQLQSG